MYSSKISSKGALGYSKSFSFFYSIWILFLNGSPMETCMYKSVVVYMSPWGLEA